jgi:hypothetical protein
MGLFMSDRPTRQMQEGEMGEVNLKEFLAGLTRKSYNSLVEYHLRRMIDSGLEMAFHGTLQLLPSWFIPSMEPLIDEWNETTRYSDFWRTPCSVVFNHIAEHAKNLAALNGGNLDAARAC